MSVNVNHKLRELLEPDRAKGAYSTAKPFIWNPAYDMDNENENDELQQIAADLCCVSEHALRNGQAELRREARCIRH